MDNLQGGEGRDTFKFNAVSEFGDVISDFAILEDEIDLSGIYGGAGSFSSNICLLQQRGNAIVQARVNGSFETVGVVLDVNANTLDSDNFKF